MHIVVALLLMMTTASANILSSTGAELPDPGSYCDVTPPGPYRISERDYWTAREVCGMRVHLLHEQYANSCNIEGKTDGVDIWIIPKVDTWNVSQAFHDDLIKHESTHSVPGCRHWHN